MPPAKKATKREGACQAQGGEEGSGQAQGNAQGSREAQGDQEDRQAKAPAKRKATKKAAKRKAPAKRKAVRRKAAKKAAKTTAKRKAVRRKAAKKGGEDHREAQGGPSQGGQEVAGQAGDEAHCAQAHGQALSRSTAIVKGPGCTRVPCASAPRACANARDRASEIVDAAERFAGAHAGAEPCRLRDVVRLARRTRPAVPRADRRCPSSSATGCDDAAAPRSCGRPIRRRARRDPRLRTRTAAAARGRCGASPCSGKKCGSRAATMPSIASSPAWRWSGWMRPIGHGSCASTTSGRVRRITAHTAARAPRPWSSSPST